MTRTGGPDPRSAHFSLVLFVSDNRLDWQSYSIAAAAPATDDESQHARLIEIQVAIQEFIKFKMSLHPGLNTSHAATTG